MGKKEGVKDAAYWRGLVAAAATVEHGVVTQFSPRGFGTAIGGHRWFSVRLGPLALHHDGSWDYVEREETTHQRMKYAHRDARSAYAALRAAVAPDEPIYAAAFEDIYSRNE